MKEQITRAVMTLKANKKVPEDCRDLSPGGYHVKDRAGKEYGFDFNWSHGDIDSQDPTKVHFEVWDPDTASFPELSDLPDHLEEITEFPECYVWVDEEQSFSIIDIESFALELSGKGKAPKRKDTPYLKFETMQTGDEYLCRCHFRRKLLNTCQSYPQG